MQTKDIELHVRAYLAQLNRKLHVAQDHLVEMEDHLISAVEDGVARGLSVDDSFALAIQSFGSSGEVLWEFEKSNQGDVMSQAKNVLSYCFEPRAFVRMALVGLAGFAFFYILLSLSGNSLDAFFRVEIFAFVVGMVSLLTLSSVPLFLWRRSNLEHLLYFLADRAGHYSVLVGFWGLMAGYVMVLMVWNQPQEIGWNVAFAVYSLLYGSVLRVFIFDLLKGVLKAKQVSEVSMDMRHSRYELFRFWLHIIFMWAILVCSLLLVGPLAYFEDVVSLAFVLGISLCPLFLKYGLKARSVKDAFLFRKDVDQAALFHRMSMAAFFAGVICTVVGLEVVFSHMDGTGDIKPALSMAILSIMYGLGGYMTWQAFECYARIRFPVGGAE